jgi:hypothetical protein
MALFAVVMILQLMECRCFHGMHKINAPDSRFASLLHWLSQILRFA